LAVGGIAGDAGDIGAERSEGRFRRMVLGAPDSGGLIGMEVETPIAESSEMREVFDLAAWTCEMDDVALGDGTAPGAGGATVFSTTGLSLTVADASAEASAVGAASAGAPVGERGLRRTVIGRGAPGAAGVALGGMFPCS